MRKINQQLLLTFFAKKEKIYPNLNREKRVIFLMIPNEEGWQ